LSLFWEDVEGKEMRLERADKNQQAIDELKRNALREEVIYLFLFGVFCMDVQGF